MILNSKIIGKSSNCIIILHGLFGSLDNWFSIGKDLSDEFEVHLVDLTNHGKSYHTNVHNYELMSRDLHNYINYHQIQNPSIIGHSMGGKVCMYFAINYSQLIKNLVVIDIAPKKYKNEHETIINALSKVSKQKVDSRKEAADILDNYNIPKHISQFLLKNLFWDEHENLTFRFNLNAIKNSIDYLLDFPVEFDTVKIKSFFIRGSKSTYINQDDLKFINKKFSNSTLIDIFDAGHWIHFDQRKQFIDTVKKILL